MSGSDGPVSLNPQGPVLADDRAARISAFVVRIAAGLLFAENLSWKIPPHFGSDDGTGLYGQTGLAVDYPVFGPLSSIVESVVLPNFGPFAWGVYLVEIGLAVFLILGLATRFWAVVGVAQALAIYMIVGASPNVWEWSYFLMMATLLAVFGTAAGRVGGLDAIVRRRVTGSSLAARVYRLSS
ncbi:MAG: DoxX family membrane protein [Actinobacteria bacterium]|nr:DoxX family membrane protein [Actinomycetota bacterium]